jgi:hypothetical protein
MPQSTKKYIAKDLLDTFDPDIQNINYDKSNEDLIVHLEPETSYLCFNEQDLVHLLAFLRQEKLK